MVRDPENRPELVAHEAVHFQQPTPTGPITLLAQSIPRDGLPTSATSLGNGIVESYYERAADKRAAVREIVQTIDFQDFLARSG